MRAPYNTTMDWYYGQASPFGTPGVRYRVGVSCRVVPQTEIVQLLFPLLYSTDWITFDGPPTPNLPNESFVGAKTYSVNWAQGDEIAVPSGAVPNFYVVAVEEVLPATRPSYYRVRVAPLPIPFP